MHRQGTTSSAASAPRRSTSSRSSTTPTSYVALMRKQKATVWCDRSQNIDHKMAAAQKMAKERATLEVHGGGTGSSGRTSTISSGSMVGKIRHHGVPRAPGYVPANLSGAGVPVRLSANEMLGDEQEGRSLGDASSSMVHARTGSGRSSTNSTKYPSGYPRSSQGRFSTSSTPPSGGEDGSPNEDIPELAEPEARNRSHDYFNDKGGAGGSGDSGPLEGEDSFGDLREMKGPSAALQVAMQAKKAEDLRRRGSVDERAMSIGTGVRLFVANPDVE